MTRFTAVLSVAAVALLPHLAQAQGRPVATVEGGLAATFDDRPGGTQFAVDAKVFRTGTGEGYFFCAIPGVVAILGDEITSATLNDDGSVTLTGFARGWDSFLPGDGLFEDMPFAVRLWAGPAGTGRFIYDDPVVGPSGGVDLAEGDRETVLLGGIRIKTR